MINGRFIQLIAALVMVASFVASGTLLPSLLDISKDHTLRYTENQVESATPEVAIGRAIGALRGILVDVLWVRASILKEKGLFYEANTLAEVITRLQPRFSAVWAFQGHNMAYNISVATQTEAERWEWVNKGINLVRNEGLRANPDDVDLYRELSFWFSHKIEGVADDAHIYYKIQFAKEWHYLLGVPPFEWNPADSTRPSPRTEWIKRVADAPDTIEEAMERTPAVSELVEGLRADLSPFAGVFQFDFDAEFLRMYGEWASVNRSWYTTVITSRDATMRLMAEQGEGAAQLRAQLYVAFDKYAADERFEEAWDTLLAFARKKVLREEYNMDPQFMYQLTRDIGPIDWRHASAHALYWSRMGEKRGETRANNEDRRFKIVNNDRQAAHAMQDLARYGMMNFDPISNDIPSRLPDTRWIQVIDTYFEYLYKKHIDLGTHGWGPDNFIAWHENYLKSAVREVYTMGDIERATDLLERLDSLYGMGHRPPNPAYSQPLDTFVQEQRHREWDAQPHVATSDVTNSLYYGIRLGLTRGDEERYERAKAFARSVLDYFRFNQTSSDFINKFGVERISGIIGSLERVEVDVFGTILSDPSIPFNERISIYQNHTPPAIQAEVWDFIAPNIEAEMRTIPGLDQRPNEQGEMVDVSVERLIPPPPGLEAVRRRRALEQQQRDAAGQ